MIRRGSRVRDFMISWRDHWRRIAGPLSLGPPRGPDACSYQRIDFSCSRDCNCKRSRDVARTERCHHTGPLKLIEDVRAHFAQHYRCSVTHKIADDFLDSGNPRRIYERNMVHPQDERRRGPLNVGKCPFEFFRGPEEQRPFNAVDDDTGWQLPLRKLVTEAVSRRAIHL